MLYDEYGVAHVTGGHPRRRGLRRRMGHRARSHAAAPLGRGPARAAVADVPGIDAFSLVTSGQSFVPSAATEELVTEQIDLLKKTYGAKGRRIIRDAQAEADGMNAWAQSTNYPNWVPATVNDVIAT